MIRCLAVTPSHLIARYPCPIHRTDRRDKRLARAVIARDGRCLLCGNTKGPFDADHIVAKAFGGRDTMANLRTVCRRTNRGGARCG